MLKMQGSLDKALEYVNRVRTRAANMVTSWIMLAVLSKISFSQEAF